MVLQKNPLEGTPGCNQDPSPSEQLCNLRDFVDPLSDFKAKPPHFLGQTGRGHHSASATVSRKHESTTSIDSAVKSCLSSLPQKDCSKKRNLSYQVDTSRREKRQSPRSALRLWAAKCHVQRLLKQYLEVDGYRSDGFLRDQQWLKAPKQLVVTAQPKCF